MEAGGSVPRPALYKVMVGVGFALAAGLVIIAFAGSSDGVPDPMTPLSVGIMCAQPAAIAARGFGRRKGVLAAAAGMSFPLMVISFSPLGFVFLIPGITYLVLYQEWRGNEPRVLAGLIGMLGFVTAVVMFGILVGHQDPACRTTATGTACSGDTVSAVEFLLISAVALVGHALCWSFSAPVRDSVV